MSARADEWVQLDGRFAPALQRRVDPWVRGLAAALALAGGVLLAGLALMVTVSVTGRKLPGLSGVPGQFEMLETGTAALVFAFLPWCQYMRGHVTVDLFVTPFGPRPLAWLATIGNLVLMLAAALVAWRLYLGLLDKIAYGETTLILQYPVWWAYAASLVGAVTFALVCAYTVWRSLNEATGRGELPPPVAEAADAGPDDGVRERAA